MALGSLVVRLGLDSAEFTAGLSKSQQKVKNFAEGAAKQFESIAKGFAAITVAATATIAAFIKVNESIASWQGNAEQIGATAEAFGSLQLAADISGTSMDTVANASAKMTAILAKTDDAGKNAAAALGAIGIKVDEFRKLDPVSQLEQVALAMNKFEEGSGKTAVAMSLFGKSGREMISFFNDLAEAGGRTVEFTEAQILASDKLAKSFNRLQHDAALLAKEIAATLVPVVQHLLDTIKDIKATNFFGWLTTSGAEAEDPSKRIKEIDKSIENLRKQRDEYIESGKTSGGIIGAIKKWSTDGSVESVDNQIAAMKKQRDYLVQLRETQIANQGGVGPPAPKLPPVDFREVASGRGGNDKAAKISEAEKYQKQLEKQLETTIKLSEYEKLYAEIESGRLGKVTDKQEAALVVSAKAIDDSKKQIELSAQQSALDNVIAQAQQRSLDNEKKKNEELKKTAEAYLNAADPLREFLAKLQEIQMLLDKGLITADQAKMIKANLGDVKQPFQEMSEFAKQAAANIQTAFADFLFDPFKDGLDGMLKGFLKIIQRMIAEAAAAYILKALFGGDGGLGGALGGLLGGSSTNTTGKKGKAAGGPVSPNASYIVGEKGPEIFKPRAAGVIVPNGQSAGGGMTFNQTLSIGEGASHSMITAAVESANQRTKADIASAYRRGQGVFA